MKKSKIANRNVMIIAQNNGEKAGFNIYLDFSGQREYLMSHRHNGLLYGLLKDGASLEEMRRLKPARIRGRYARKAKIAKLYGQVAYLVSVIDEYMLEREAA